MVPVLRTFRHTPRGAHSPSTSSSTSCRTHRVWPIRSQSATIYDRTLGGADPTTSGSASFRTLAGGVCLPSRPNILSVAPLPGPCLTCLNTNSTYSPHPRAGKRSCLNPEHYLFCQPYPVRGLPGPGMKKPLLPSYLGDLEAGYAGVIGVLTSAPRPGLVASRSVCSRTRRTGTFVDPVILDLSIYRSHPAVGA